MRKVTSLSWGSYLSLPKKGIWNQLCQLNLLTRSQWISSLWKGKTAIVTGGNSGLGQAFAMALAKAGS